MGKLNSLIKFVVFNANALLFLGGLGMIVVASIFLAADFIKLAQSYLQTRGIVTVAIGVLVAGMSIVGCVGTHRQIQRDRLWSGRRVLSLYQLLLLTIVVGQGVVQMNLYSIEVSLDEAATELPEEHGDFESQFRDGFNDAYYEQLCAAGAGGDDWIWSLVATHCPESISRDMCSCSDILNGAGLPRNCTAEATYMAEECCPDEEFCEAGLEEACPYAACRTGILEALLNYITPARKYSTFVFVLEGMLLILTCLLICYNPRDTTEDILIKTGTIMRHQTQPGGGDSNSKSADLEGAVKPSAGIDQDAFKLDLVQPAAMARRAAAAGARAGTRASPARSTPPLSPMAAAKVPTEPLRQFMTPRRSVNDITHTAVSPAENDEYIYEYQNPRKGRSAAVGPPMASVSKVLTAAQRSAARGAGAVADSATASTTTAATITAAAAAAVGLAVGPASTSRKRGGKSSQGDSEEKEKGMDDSDGGFVIAPLPPMEDEVEDEEKTGGEFYDRLGAQTPVAEYAAHDFETSGGASAAPRPGAAALRNPGSFDPDVFLTDVSSPHEESPPKSYPPAGGKRTFEGPPSPIVSPQSPSFGDKRNTDVNKPSRFGGQTPIMTSPMAASRQDLKIAVSTTVDPVSETKGVFVAPTSEMRARPVGLSAQTPVASPTGAEAPPTYREHTAATNNRTEEGRDEARSNPAEVATTPARAVDATERASSKNLAISNQADTETGTDLPHHEEESATVSPRPTGFLGRFLAQTPPGGVAAGFDASGKAPSQEQQQQQQRRGSAAYPQSSGGTSSSLAVDSALAIAEFVSEKPSGLQTAVSEQTVVRELDSSTVDGDSSSTSDQAPITSQQNDKEALPESSVSKGILPTTAAEAASGGGKGKEGVRGREATPLPAKGDDQVNEGNANTAEAATDGAVTLGLADAAAPASLSGSQPQSQFTRFLLKAEESLSKAQMALSLGLQTTAPARETSSDEISTAEHGAASLVPIAEATPDPTPSTAEGTDGDGAASGVVNEGAAQKE